MAEHTPETLKHESPQLRAELDAARKRISRLEADTSKIPAILAELAIARKRIAELEKALQPFANVWNGNQDGTTRIPWEALKEADRLLAEKPQ